MITIRETISAYLDELKTTCSESFNNASIQDFGSESMIPPGAGDGSLVKKGFEEKTCFTLLWNNIIVGGLIVELRDTKDHY